MTRRYDPQPQELARPEAILFRRQLGERLRDACDAPQSDTVNNDLLQLLAKADASR